MNFKEAYLETKAMSDRLRAGSIAIDATELFCDETCAVYVGMVEDPETGEISSRLFQTQFSSGQTSQISIGPNNDRHPHISPNGASIAFLSDADSKFNFQLRILSRRSGIVRKTGPITGTIEYLRWSPDGLKILVGVAGNFAEVSGNDGGFRYSDFARANMESWSPDVEMDAATERSRTLWIYDVDRDELTQLSPIGINIWEAAWCGPEAVTAITSKSWEESAWYTATLDHFELATGKRKTIYGSHVQLGWPAGSPSGQFVAFVEAVCSDRQLVAGNLVIVGTNKSGVRRIQTAGIDVTHIAWLSDQLVLIAGVRGLHTVVASYDLSAGALLEWWSSVGLTASSRYPQIAPIAKEQRCGMIVEGFASPPAISIVSPDGLSIVRELNSQGAETIKALLQSESVVKWTAPDGSNIEGWLLLPHSKAPQALVVQIHGGPILQWRTHWLGRAISTAMLLNKGYAVFQPNPRGSSGYGQNFASAVVQDVGGADMSDLISGVDELIGRGLVNGRKVGLMGGSYGGFMTSWIITQTDRFAAAVPIAPITNWVSQHLISNIPAFDERFLAGTIHETGGQYHTRSPVNFADRVTTPTMIVCGRLDRCTPQAQASEFRNALVCAGVTTEMLTYPDEGHGVRGPQAKIDFAARVVCWFQRFMPATDLL
jgi:dipeptidyl aminopeptidase/acylaminoacyl peptidase